MKITIGRFIKRKEDYDSENIICPIEDYNRTKYLNRRILFRVLFIILYGFGFGYMLALNVETINDVIISVRDFTLFYIVSFYLIQIPHEFIHTIFYPNPFKNSKNSLVFFNKKRIVTSELGEDIHPFILCISLITPFILFSIMPLITIKYIGFDLYLYCLSFANAILSSDDLLNIILQLFVRSKEGTKKLFVIPNNYNYLIVVNDSNNIDKTIYCEEKTIIKKDNESNSISNKEIEENSENSAMENSENSAMNETENIKNDNINSGIVEYEIQNNIIEDTSEVEIETTEKETNTTIDISNPLATENNDTEEVNNEISENTGILNNE